MPLKARCRRRLHLEALEPRWTMDAQACPAGTVDTAYFVCETTTAAPTAPTSDVQAVEQSLNQFALDVYKTITDSNSDEPLDEAISPFSIAAAFAMVYAGADGATASQLAHALHIDIPPDRFHAAMQSILHDILPAADDTAQLDIANALWGQTGFPFLDSFKQLTHDRYAADFHEADFQTEPGAATNAINQWVKTQTHDKIDKLFDSLPNETRLVLANALYFKASWAKSFQAYATQRTAFHLASGSTLDVSMMHNGGYYLYTETNDYQIAELPYEDNRYSMVVLLPKQADAKLSANFSAADLQNWLSDMHSADLALALPKFKLAASMSLIDTLRSLGVTDAFGSVADFSGIDGRQDLFISQAVHKAVVEVNEKGTEAAAATGIGVSPTSCFCFAPAPIPFYADHPFHFLIRDRDTNTILFLGQVQKPSTYDGSSSTSTELPKPIFAPNPQSTMVFDVDRDGQETPLDALIVINFINDHPASSVAAPKVLLTDSGFNADVDRDGHILPLDALLIINRLNQRSLQTPAIRVTPSQPFVQAEGEAVPDGQLDSSSIDIILSLDEPFTPSLNRPAASRSQGSSPPQ